MSDAQRRIHWENVYQTKGERDVSWFRRLRGSLSSSFNRQE